MKKITRLVAFFLVFVMLVSMIPISALNIFANTEKKVDAMTEIESTHSSSKVGETQTLTTEGFIGISIKMTVYSTRTEPAIVGPGLDSTPVIVYVVNTMATRTGTDSDSDIIADMLSKGYIVLVLDYQNNEKAVSPDLDWSVQGLLAGIKDGKYFPENDSKFPSGKYQNTILVPAGHNVTFNHVYFEMDKHAADGTLDRIVHAWNNDFRGVFAKTVVKWTRPDGTKKPTQNGFDGSAPVWYSDAAGTVEDANGQYIMIKHTKAETITDCTKADGTPIDLNLYMHIVYPTNPVKEVPVMSMACSSEQLAGGLRTADRPHVNGFLFDGYAISIFDHAYVPMSREDHYGYFDGNTMQGHVTGDNISYTVNLYNMQKTETAAMRYMRYLALTEPQTYKFNLDAIGVVGNSKGSIINFLGAPELQIASNKAIGDAGIADQNALDDYVDTKINALMSQFDLPGHHGESRYQNGDTETVVKDGATIDGGTLQPWITYNGEEIASGANFVYANCGGTPQLVKEGYQPYYVSLHIGSGEQSGYTNQNYMVNLARQYDIPCLYFESSLGHTLVGREELNYGINPYNAYKDFANFVLNNGAIKVAYTTPLDKSMNVDTTANITVKFTGMAELSEVQKIVITDGTNAVTGSWTSSFGGTEWTFHPNTMNSAAKYTITVPADFKGTNGVAMGTAYTGVFTTKGEAVIGGGISATTVTSTSGVNVEFTAPNMADYAAVNANQFLLRVKVANDAANIANVYAVSSLSDTSTAKLVGKANLKGDGYYDIDISSYMETVTAGEKVYLFIKAEKAASVSQTFSQTFDSTNGFDTNGRGNYDITTAPDGETSALKVTLNMKTGVNGLDYYINESQVLFNNRLFKDGALSDADYGRKFTVTMRVYDTTSRQLMLQISGRTNASNQIRDYQTPRYNVTTTANEWQTITMEYTVYDMEYGWAGYQSRAFQMYMSSDGDNQSPIYFDYINVTETVTDVEVSDVALVLANEGSTPYKAPESTENAFAVNGTSYTTFKSALAGYTSGQTVKLLKNYTFTDSDITDLSAFANVVIDLNGYKLIAANTSKAPIYIKAASTDTVTVTVKNGSILAGSSALISYNDSVAAGSGKTVNINFENVYIGLDEGAKTQKLITTNTATSGVKITSNITFTDCELDIDQSKHTNNPMIVLPGESADIDINYNMLGGSIKVSSFTMTTVHESFSSLVLNKNTSGNYPTLILPNSVVLGANSYRYGDTSGSFVLPESGYDADGYTEYTLASTALSTKYGVIPEQYADEEQYPFVVFDEMGNATGYADLLNSAGNGALDKIREKNADYSIIMRRDFALTSQSYNIAFIYGGVTLDLQGHTLDTKGYTLFWAAGKRPKTTTFNVIDGTIIMKGAPLIVYEAANNSNYNIDTHGVKTFDFIFDNVNFTLNAGSTPTKMFTQTKTLSIRMDTSITLNDCVIDLTNLTSATTFFDLGSSNDLLYCDYQINGGNIIAPSFDKLTLYNKLGENAAMLFGKGSDGEYTKATLSSTAKAPTWFVTSENDKLLEFKQLSAENTTTVYQLGESSGIQTEYGIIPESAKDFAWIVFANGEFVAGYDVYCNDNFATTPSALGHARELLYAKKTATEVQVLLTKNFSNGTNYGNLSHIEGNLIIDLQDYTFTCAGGVLLRACSKTNGQSNITVKGGTIKTSSAPVIQAYAYGGSTDYTTTKTFNITFEGTNFEISSANGILVTWGGTGNSKAFGSTYNIDFNDCNINITTSSAVKLFQATDSENTNNSHITVSGGSIKASSLDAVTLWTLDSGDSIVFNPNAKGEYTKLILPEAKSAPTTAFPTDKGDMYLAGYNIELSAWLTVSNRIYMLGNEKLNGQYIPYGCTAENYPFAVYVNGELYGLYDTWATKSICSTGSPTAALEAAYMMFNGNDITILLRDDYTVNGTTEYFENFGNRSTGSLTVDLGGHTLTSTIGKSLIILQAKNAGNANRTLTITFKNGTMLTKQIEFIQISSYGSDANNTGVFNVNFTDVTLGYASGATGKSFIKYATGSGWNAVASTFNLTFNNCTFDAKTNVPSNAIMLDLNYKGGTAEHTVTLNVNGGKMLIANSASTTMYTISENAGSSCTFGKSTDKYTELYITSGDAPTGSYTTDAGEKVFVQTGTEGGATIYTLGDKPVEPIVTPYGNIPGDTVLSTYAVFTGGNYIGTYSTLVQALDAANAQYTAGAEQVQIMLNSNASETATYSNWSSIKDLVIDLNGYTLTNNTNGNAFNIHCNTSNVTTITFKNGALSHIYAPFIRYSSTTGGENKILNLIFENITNVSTDQYDWQFVVQNGAGTLVPLTLNITCNDVHFNYTNAGVTLFDIRSRNSDNSTANANLTANITINGGSLTMPKVLNTTIMAIANKQTGTANTLGAVNLTFGKYNGEYLKINTSTFSITETFYTTYNVPAFSEVSTGVYSIVEPDIEISGSTGGSYTDIQTAINNTAAGGTVTINKDITGDSIVALNAITIDLNGNILTVDGILAAEAITFIDSGTGTKGLIKVARGNVTIGQIIATNAILVYNQSRGGYELATVTEQIQPVKGTLDAANEKVIVELVFRPSLGDLSYNSSVLTGTYTDADTGELNTNADLKLIIKLYDENGNVFYNQNGNQNGWEYSASLINTVYSEGKAFKFTAKVPTKHTKIKYEYILVSGTDMQCVVGTGEYVLSNAE